MIRQLRIVMCLLAFIGTCWLASGCGYGPPVVKTVEPSPKTQESQEKLDTLK